MSSHTQTSIVCNVTFFLGKLKLSNTFNKDIKYCNQKMVKAVRRLGKNIVCSHWAVTSVSGDKCWTIERSLLGQWYHCDLLPWKQRSQIWHSLELQWLFSLEITLSFSVQLSINFGIWGSELWTEKLLQTFCLFIESWICDHVECFRGRSRWPKCIRRFQKML